ncbi:MAG: hypothetical protein SFX73_22565 [Kofleriaceae bacterium]|nr:hypothetical protein [Kofleriaceae bacterium]
MRRTLALAALLGACDGTSGTINLDLTTAPGSTVLDNVERLRLSVSNPWSVFETPRGADGGFDLAVDVEAGVSAALIVEGFDASGDLVATGMSPEVAFAPTNARLVIYVAPPMSVAAAPMTLSPPRAGVSIDALTYGAVFAGGEEAPDAPSDKLQIYNAYDHSLVAGLPVPMPRTGVAVGGAPSSVYLFGGTEAEGETSGELTRFDTTVSPNGAYQALGETPSLARTGERMVRIAAETFLVTGSPPILVDNFTLSARTDLATLPTVGAARPDGSAAIFVGGDTGLVRFRNNTFDALPGEVARQRAAITVLPSEQFLVVGGGPVDAPLRSVLLVDAATGMVMSRPDTLAVGRYAPAVAATPRHVVVAGGVDASGAPIATAEILDATTLERVATLPIAPRVGTAAIALPTHQVLIGGGIDANELLELFTPPPLVP